MENFNELDDATKLVLECVEYVLEVEPEHLQDPEPEPKLMQEPGPKSVSNEFHALADITNFQNLDSKTELLNLNLEIQKDENLNVYGPTYFVPPNYFKAPSMIDSPKIYRPNNYQYYQAQGHNQLKKCNFCRKNGENSEFYNSHSLNVNGRTTCPVLQKCVCKLCGVNGHTLSHCPQNQRRSILKLIHQYNATH